MIKRLTLLALLLATPALAAGSSRFALLFGNDLGGQGRPRLWFAQHDAQRMARALTELGDFPSDNVLLLEGKGPAEVKVALERLNQRIATLRDKGEKTLLLLYYSGHADGTGLELGAERFSFEDLRRAVSGSPADVKVAIVDACQAGNLTQVKGGTAAPTLDFLLPGEERVEGTAFVASTAVGELAQESAALGGSFFTHHLEAGLRGAADADADGRITLNEAFRYTAGRTVSGTLETAVGAQHPTYDMRMSGRGDVVLADLRHAVARLVLPAAPGVLYVVRGPRELTAEVPGAAVPLVMALPAGRYQIERRLGATREIGTLDLASGERRELPTLQNAGYLDGRTKGSFAWSELSVSAVGGSSLLDNVGPFLGGRLGYERLWDSWAVRVRGEYRQKNVVDEGLRYDFWNLAGAFGVLWQLTDGPLRVQLGPELGLGWNDQRLANGQHFGGSDFSAGAALCASLPLGPVRLGLDFGAAEHLFFLNKALAARPTVDLALVLAYPF